MSFKIRIIFSLCLNIIKAKIKAFVHIPNVGYPIKGEMHNTPAVPDIEDKDRYLEIFNTMKKTTKPKIPAQKFVIKA